MNWLDITIIVICAAGIIQGLVKGFIRQVFSLLGLIFAIIIAFRYHDILARYLSKWIEHPVSLMILSFILVLVVVMVLFKLIGLAARVAISAISIGWLDRLAGGVFGLVKSIIVVAVLFGLFILCTDRPTRPVAESNLTPMIMEISYVIARFLPSELRERYDRNEEEIREHLDSYVTSGARGVKATEPASSHETTTEELSSSKKTSPSEEALPPGETQGASGESTPL